VSEIRQIFLIPDNGTNQDYLTNQKIPLSLMIGLIQEKMHENNLVILVDKNDYEIGIMKKLKAHQGGRLHRALSVFVFNEKNELLLQKRALSKYHSGGLWTNTCCSHPQPGENVQFSAERRLREEMGLTCHLTYAFQFQYETKLNNNLIENELDHVFIGYSRELPNHDPAEVEEWKYMSIESLNKEFATNPRKYTEWLKICFNQLKTHFEFKGQYFIRLVHDWHPAQYPHRLHL